MLAGVAASSPVQASPWIDPGDVRMRHSLQRMSDAGHSPLLTSTWPLPWSDVAQAVRLTPGRTGAEVDVFHQRSYVQFELNRATRRAWSSEAVLGGATQAPLLRGFAALPREQAELGVDRHWQGDRFAAALDLTYADDPVEGFELRFDGSYLAGRIGGWVLGGGSIDRWWGPGWQSSLVLSTNARPVMGAWFQRQTTEPSQWPGLSWMGPWQLTGFTGELDDDREVSGTQLSGMRLTMMPIQGLEIGASRTVLWGGDGQSGGLSGLGDAWFRDQEDDDAARDLLALDMRYGFALGGRTAGVYAQTSVVDDGHGFSSRHSHLLGLDWTTPWWGADQQWFLEAVETARDEHDTYASGYRYNGRDLATSFDGDALAVTLGLHHFFRNGHHLSGSLTRAELNRGGQLDSRLIDAPIPYAVADAETQFWAASIGYQRTALGGWLELRGEWRDHAFSTLDQDEDRWQWAGRWRYRF